MTVARAKGPKAKADKLFSLLIRSRGYCENCGETDYAKLQTAHIVGRAHNATRVDENNAFCLCWTCHHHFTHWPLEFATFVESKIGREKYEALKAKAKAGVKVSPAFWIEEAVRLQMLLNAQGDDAA